MFHAPIETAYRLYWIDGAGQVDAVAEVIRATSDECAARQAAELAEGDRVELWAGTRLVARLGPMIGPQAER